MSKTSEAFELRIEPDGNVRMIYNELVDPKCFGQASIQRGSHVEPDLDGHWYADLSPTNGPKLGAVPFTQPGSRRRGGLAYRTMAGALADFHCRQRTAF